MKKLIFLMMTLCLMAMSSVGSIAEIDREGGYPPQGYCRAKSTLKIIYEIMNNVELGNDCEINCPPSHVPSCHGYFFTSSCECISITPPPQPTIVMPTNLSPGDLQIADDFITFCTQSESSSINQLGTYVSSAKSAYQNNNSSAYIAAEIQYDLLFDQLGSSDLSEIEAWINNYGD